MRAGLLLVAIVAAAPSRAQARDPLELAEQAYLRVDFEATFEHARAALEAGGYARERLVRIYQLMGIAAAALEREEEAREAYIRMLAIEPDRDVDRNLAPRLRSPFLEARGYWTARSDRLEADVRVDRAQGGLVVRLEDPLDMAEAVVLHARVAGDAGWRETRQPALATQLFPLEGAASADRIEYVLEVLDAHGNHLIELGSLGAPRNIGEAPTGGGGPAPEPADEGGSVFASPVFWVVAGAVLIGGGATAFFLASDRSYGAETRVTIGFQ